MKKFSKVVLILFFPMVLIGGYLFYPSILTKQDQFTPEVYFSRQDWQHAQAIMEKVQSWWDQPDRIKEVDWKNSDCPWWDFKNYHRLVDLRQNFLVLKCLLGEKTKVFDQVKGVNNYLEFNFQGDHYFIKKSSLDSDYFENLNFANIQPNEYLPHEGIKFVIGKKNHSKFLFEFTLSYDQKIKYLPQASYFYGQDINQLPIQHRRQETSLLEFANVRPWDNVGRFILIDKVPVRNYELALWNRNKEVINNLAPALLKPELYVTYLSRSDQEQYCQSRGMQLLDAAVFDAATFYRDIRNYQEEKSRSLFYFGNRWPLKNKCQMQKTLDCKDEQIEDMQVSWMGLLDFTSNFESLANIFHPSFNLRPGSKYFKENSAWQYLANRLQWDGIGFTKENFKWISSITGSNLEANSFESNLPIQFRCMKEWISYP